MRVLVGILVISLGLLGACSEAVPDARRDVRSDADGAADEAAPATEPAPDHAPPKKVDPRDGGLEVTLGEWAITPEADTIRPGKVTFVIRNRGTMAHGFEIELEGDNSGSGSGDLFKAESRLLQPGESTRMTFELAPAVYKIECLVDGHDDMGMEGMLEVRAGAPLHFEKPKDEPNTVAISDFAFVPSTVVVPAGTEVTWRNDDPTDHTVTSTSNEFGSAALGDGGTFSHGFAQPGTYAYRCAIHPDMKGQVKVE